MASLDWRALLGIRPRESAPTALAVRSYPDPPIPLNSQQGGYRQGSVYVTPDTAMRNSAVWACTNLRAGLMSSFPLRAWRQAPGGERVDTTLPPVLVSPSKVPMTRREWMFSTQMDLDRNGNAFGLVTEFSAQRTERWPKGIPLKIELVQLGTVTVMRRDGELVYRVAGKEYELADVWHERAHTLPGLDVGLSPIAYAAMSIGGYLSAQEFALTWFGGNKLPSSHLKNTVTTISPEAAALTKTHYKNTVAAGDVFVTGNDWELTPITAGGAENDFIQSMQFSVPDICRFFGVPADLVDGAIPGSSITYANMTQRNLQFLIMNLGPAIVGREDALTTLTPSPRYVELVTDTLIRLDPLQQAQLDKLRIDSRTRTPDETRHRDNLQPLSEDDYVQFERLFGKKAAGVAAATDPVNDQNQPQQQEGAPA